MTLLNNSVELSSNLDKPVPLKSSIRTPLLTQTFELLSSSVGWGAGLQSSTLVQGKSSYQRKVLTLKNPGQIDPHSGIFLIIQEIKEKRFFNEILAIPRLWHKTIGQLSKFEKCL